MNKAQIIEKITNKFEYAKNRFRNDFTFKHTTPYYMTFMDNCRLVALLSTEIFLIIAGIMVYLFLALFTIPMLAKAKLTPAALVFASGFLFIIIPSGIFMFIRWRFKIAEKTQILIGRKHQYYSYVRSLYDGTRFEAMFIPFNFDRAVHHREAGRTINYIWLKSFWRLDKFRTIFSFRRELWHYKRLRRVIRQRMRAEV